MHPARSLPARFRVEERVAAGAYGTVYRALDTSTGTRVAIKQLHHEIEDPAAAQRFEREADILARIRSPYVVGFVDRGSPGDPWFALEWLEGEDLARRMRRAPLDRATALGVLAQSALGLDALHREGFIHRDVKPSNIVLVEQQGALVAKLIDLGIARGEGDVSTLTQEGFLIGTPSYMSPEQARGEREITPRSDLFSLGVMAFELLAGKRPFVAPDPVAVLAKIVLGDTPDLRVIAPDLPRALIELIESALQKKPEFRVATARVMANGFEGMRLQTTGSARREVPVDANDATQVREVTAISAAAETGTDARVMVLLLVHAPVAALDLVAREIERSARAEQGVVHWLLGGHAVVVFASARSIGEEAVLGVRCARSLRAMVPGLRAAISTTRAIANASGVDGDAIDRGAKQLEWARDEIVVDANTARLLGDRYAIRGDGERLSIDERAESQRMAASRPLLGRETSMVGRDTELALLDRMWATSLEEGLPQGVLVTGAAGTGKSRLRFEFARRVTDGSTDVRCWLARADPFTQGSAFALLADMVRRACGAGESDEARSIRAMLDADLDSRFDERDRERIVDHLVLLLRSTADNVSADVHQDAVVRGDQIRDAFIRWIDATAENHPLLVLVEDYHWADATSRAMLDDLIETLAGRRLMVVAFTRPDGDGKTPDCALARRCTLSLRELSAKAALALVTQAIPHVAEPDARRIVERAGGNAFFLEELVRHVAEGRSEELPETIAGVLQARMDAMTSDERHIARLASVVGREFWREAVATLAGLEPAAADTILRSLEKREICSRRANTRFRGVAEFAFRHALVRDVAYRQLGEAERAGAHGRAFEWLQRAGEVDARILAEHLERSGALARAVEYLYLAAERSLEGNDFAEADRLASVAVERGAQGEQLGVLRLIQAEASKWRGDNATTAKRAVEARDLLSTGSARWHHAASEAALAEMSLGITTAMRFLADYLLAHPNAGHDRASAISLCRMAIVHRYAGDHDTAARLASRFDSAPEAVRGDALVGAWHARMRLTIATRSGANADTLRFGLEAARLFEEVGDIRAAVTAALNLGATLAAIGLYEEAAKRLRTAIEAARRIGIERSAMLGELNLVLVLGRIDRFDESTAVAAAVIARSRALGNVRFAAHAMLYRAITHLEHGRVESALAQAEELIEFAPSMRNIEAVARAVIADCRRRLGDLPRALESAERAYSILKDLGTLEVHDMHVRVAFADALVAQGRLDEARAVLGEAHALLETNARSFDGDEQRRAYLEAIPEHARLRALFAAHCSAER